MRDMLRGLQGWFQLHGFNSVDASRKSLAAIYGMVQQQAAMLSFVEAFWVMGVIFLGMLPLLLLLRNARSLHPHTRKTDGAVGQPRSVAATVEPEEELVGIGR
jgi:hypothetical protein